MGLERENISNPTGRRSVWRIFCLKRISFAKVVSRVVFWISYLLLRVKIVILREQAVDVFCATIPIPIFNWINRLNNLKK